MSIKRTVRRLPVAGAGFWAGSAIATFEAGQMAFEGVSIQDIAVGLGGLALAGISNYFQRSEREPYLLEEQREREQVSK